MQSYSSVYPLSVVNGFTLPKHNPWKDAIPIGKSSSNHDFWWPMLVWGSVSLSSKLYNYYVHTTSYLESENISKAFSCDPWSHRNPSIQKSIRTTLVSQGCETISTQFWSLDRNVGTSLGATILWWAHDGGRGAQNRDFFLQKKCVAGTRGQVKLLWLWPLKTGWWFHFFFLCSPQNWEDSQFWLIFFKGVETTDL